MRVPCCLSLNNKIGRSHITITGHSTTKNTLRATKNRSAGLPFLPLAFTVKPRCARQLQLSGHAARCLTIWRRDGKRGLDVGGGRAFRLRGLLAAAPDRQAAAGLKERPPWRRSASASSMRCAAARSACSRGVCGVQRAWAPFLRVDPGPMCSGLMIEM